jgi:homoserine kinase type II
MAVYTHLSAQDINNLLTQYEIGTLVDYQPIAEGIENSNYLLQTSTNKYVLTIFEKRARLEDLPFFLTLKQHLAHKGFPCPAAITSKTNDLLCQLHHKPAVIISFLEGKSILAPSKNHCHEVGKTLANLHRHTADFTSKRPYDFGFTALRELYRTIEPHINLSALALPMLDMVELLDTLENNWPDNLPQGIIHADLFPDNVLFSNDKISGVLDFYFASHDNLLLDLAITINAWCFDTQNQLDMSKARALLTAYHTHRPIGGNEFKAFPSFLLFAACRFLLTRLHDSIHSTKDALVTPKDPNEYLAKCHLHQQHSIQWKDLVT